MLVPSQIKYPAQPFPIAPGVRFVVLQLRRVPLSNRLTKHQAEQIAQGEGAVVHGNASEL
jgi:hypothetical protein